MGLTYDELYITPENSTINILVKTGIIHELAELFKKVMNYHIIAVEEIVLVVC